MYMKTREEGFGAEVKRRIMLGTYCCCLRVSYDAILLPKRKRAGTLLETGHFLDAFSRDATRYTPDRATTAFKIGEKSDDPLAMYLSGVYTARQTGGNSGNFSPCGFSENLPIWFAACRSHWSKRFC
jgi:aspartyl-tRNA(Asn)/glutamyl-tRNA(Gln) amidotransferase subunit A